MTANTANSEHRDDRSDDSEQLGNIATWVDNETIAGSFKAERLGRRFKSC